MPWEIVEDHPDCDEPYAVVKQDDGELEGCHETRSDAEDQLAALNIAEAQDGDAMTEELDNETMLGPLLTDLSSYYEDTELVPLAVSKPFDGLVPVRDAIDMHGNPITITEDELSEYLANTKIHIESQATESGEIVGLPIDEKAHNKGDGAGWIVDVELTEGIIQDKLMPILRIIPKWTELGIEKISKGIQRYFSATVDTKNKIILGGTLTNWPALPLRPIELQDGIYKLQGEALDEDSFESRIEKVERAWHNQQMPMPMGEELWPMRVFEDFLILQQNEQLWRVPYSMNDDGEVEFDAPDDWVEVKRAYVEAMQDEQTSITLELKPNDVEVIEVQMTEQELAELVGKQVNEALATVIKQTAGEYQNGGGEGDEGDGTAFDPVAFLELEEAQGDVVQAFKAKMLEQYDAMKEQASREAAQMIAGIRREQNTAELAQRVTGGTDDAPRGVKVDADELQEHLLSLPKSEAEWWGNLLDGIVKHGLVEFSERGHGRVGKGQKPVPEYAHASLTEALSKGVDPVEFFEAAGLGDASQYDLSEFEEANNG